MNTTALIALGIIFFGALGMLWLARYLNERDQNK